MENYTHAKALIRSIKDYPKPGIIFRDITPLLEDFQAFSICIDELSSRVKELNFDKIACIDARGFITGIACAMKLSKSFFLLRKKGKLPYKTFAEDFAKVLQVDAETLHNAPITTPVRRVDEVYAARNLCLRHPYDDD